MLTTPTTWYYAIRATRKPLTGLRWKVLQPMMLVRSLVENVLISLSQLNFPVEHKLETRRVSEGEAGESFSLAYASGYHYHVLRENRAGWETRLSSPMNVTNSGT